MVEPTKPNQRGERQRTAFEGTYLRNLAASREYARSLWSAKKVRLHL